MKKINSILWGIVIICIGVIIALNSLGLIEFDVFFDGWWTLLIIVPCAIGFFTERDKTGNLIGLIIGVCLLLCCQDVLSFGILWKLLVPAIIIIIGVKIIVSAILEKKANEIIVQMKKNGNNSKSGFAAFSGCNMNFDGEIFEGAELSAVFGGVKCDLRNAVFESDCAIQATAVFGGIDILVPSNVNVKINGTSLFGGISDKAEHDKNSTITLYVNGTSIFGGIDVK